MYVQYNRYILFYYYQRIFFERVYINPSIKYDEIYEILRNR